MNEHPIHELLNISLDKVIHMIDTSKIIGSPIDIGNSRKIIPITKVSFGFGAGGSDFESKQVKKNLFNIENSEDLFPFGGGSAGGVSISPLAFIVVENNKIDIIYANKVESIYDKLFSLFEDFSKSKTD